MAPSRMSSEVLTVDARPYPFTFPLRHTALLVIDMQRDFLLPHGFGDIQGGNLEAVQASIAPNKQLLELFRKTGMHVFHTREGHQPDLSDCPSSKLIRQAAAPGNEQHKLVIGDKGSLGRLLVRGEYGHDIIDELQPVPGEIVIDKPGKGAFYNTKLMESLQARAITHLVVTGVTTECCFATTIREANDRGFECCGISEATAGYNSCFKDSSLDMLWWSQGLFGFVSHLQPFLDAFKDVSMQPSKGSDVTPPQTPPTWNGDITISGLSESYQCGLSVQMMLESLYERIEKYQKTDPAVWIHLVSKEDALVAARDVMSRFPDKSRLPPLFGIPFSVKDSIDVAGIPTTTACPPLAFIPTVSAKVYQRLIDQGAIFIGKTNLDQLATGLTGCRSPYGITKSVFNPDYVSGGSSSGNAVSVGAGLVSFSLATDTAGSGRVPAIFNGVVGFKPTRGTLSAHGLTPACASLDCMALMASNVEDTRLVWTICEAFDEDYIYAKSTPPNLRSVNSLGPQVNAFRFGIPPPEVLSVCSPIFRKKFNDTVHILQSLGGVLTPIDWSPFEKAGNLLYDGSFVCERLASLPDGWLETNRDHLHPVILKIFEAVVARNSTAVDAYRDLQAKQLYTRQAEKVFSNRTSGIDVLVVPTAPTHWTIAEVLDDPIAKNSILGTFTHFGNVLDLTGMSVPSGTYALKELKPDAESPDKRMPFAVTLLGGSRTDYAILEIGRRLEEHFINDQL